MNVQRTRFLRLILGGLLTCSLCVSGDAQAPGAARGVRGQLWKNQVNRDAGALVQPGKIQRSAPVVKPQEVRKRLGQDIQRQLKNQTRNAVKQIQRDRVKDLIRDRSRQNLVQQKQRSQAAPTPVSSKEAITTTRQQTADPASEISQRRISVSGAETGVDNTGNKVATQPAATREITKMTRSMMRAVMQTQTTVSDTSTTVVRTDTTTMTDEMMDDTTTTAIRPTTTAVSEPTTRTDVKPAPRPIITDVSPVDPAPTDTNTDADTPTTRTTRDTTTTQRRKR